MKLYNVVLTRLISLLDALISAGDEQTNVLTELDETEVFLNEYVKSLDNERDGQAKIYLSTILNHIHKAKKGLENVAKHLDVVYECLQEAEKVEK